MYKPKVMVVGLKNLNMEGGIETYVKNVVPRLAKKYDVHIIVNADNQKSLSSVSVHPVFYVPGRYTNKLSMVPAILWETLRISPDVVYANDSAHGFFVKFFFRRTPMLYIAHGINSVRTDWPKFVRIFWKMIEEYCFRHADKVVAVDEKTAQYVQKFRKDRVLVIPNGVDVLQFEGKIPKPKEFRHKTNILFVGRMIKSKGVYDAVDVFKDLPRDIGLYFVGRGPESENLKKIAKKYSNIVYVGFVESVIPYHKHANIFIMPSYYEGMPIVLLEAFAAGTPAICYDVGDIRKRFGDIAIILPKGDKKGLKNWILKLANDKKLAKKLGQKAKEKVKREYTWDAVASKISELLDSLLNQKSH